jgi:hypothetical protein
MAVFQIANKVYELNDTRKRIAILTVLAFIAMA